MAKLWQQLTVCVRVCGSNTCLIHEGKQAANCVLRPFHANDRQSIKMKRIFCHKKAKSQ